MNKSNHPFSFRFHFHNPWLTEKHGGRDLNLKNTQIGTGRVKDRINIGKIPKFDYENP